MKEFWIYLKELSQQFTSNHEQEANRVATKRKNPHENPVREVMDVISHCLLVCQAEVQEVMNEFTQP